MKYSYQGPLENTAKAKTARERVSPKKTMETCRAIRGMNAKKALKYLEGVKQGKEVVPYTKHKKQMPHAKGGKPGGYPKKPAEKIEQVLKNALKNAEHAGLDEEKMKIVHSAAYKSGEIPRYAKKRPRKTTQLATIEVVLKQTR